MLNSRSCSFRALVLLCLLVQFAFHAANIHHLVYFDKFIKSHCLNHQVLKSGAGHSHSISRSNHPDNPESYSHAISSDAISTFGKERYWSESGASVPCSEEHCSLCAFSEILRTYLRNRSVILPECGLSNLIHGQTLSNVLESLFLAPYSARAPPITA